VTAGARPRVVLVGPPGSLAPEAGRELGRRLGVAVRDTDDDVVAAAGKPVAEVFVEDGEAAFRDLERDAVARALAEHDGVVVLGSGAVMDPLTEQALARHTVAFLDVSVADAARRLGLAGPRPAGLGNPRAQWLRLMEHRRPVYARIATVTVPTDGLDAAGVAERVEAALLQVAP
jgi:shikimate kinase